MNEKTIEFLEACKDAGIEKVAIGCCHESVPSSMLVKCIIPEYAIRDIVFSEESKGLRKKNKTDWPVIWKIAGDIGLDDGTGWTDTWCFRKQPFEVGVYHLVDGEWKEAEGDKE